MNNLKNNIYYINLCLLLFKVFYSNSNIIYIPDILSKLITFFVLFTFFIHLILNFFRNCYDKKIGYIYIILMFLLIMSSYITKDYNLILTFFLLIFAEENDIKKILKLIIYINFIMLFLHIFVYILNSMFNFLDDYMVYYNNDGNIRHNFFLGHPNYFSSILFGTYIAYVYLKYEKMNIFVYLLGIILAIFTFIFPGSRTAAFSFIIFLFLVYITRKASSSGLRISKFLSKYTFLILTIFVFLYFIFYKSLDLNVKNLINSIDTLVSGRLWYSYRAYQKYGFTILGQFVDYSSIYLYNKRLILDSFYVKLLINYGILYAFLINYVIIKYSKQLKEKDYPFIIIFSIIAFFESHVMNPCIGIALFIIACTMKNNRSVEKYEKA